MVVDDPEAHLPMVIVVIHLRTGLFLTWYLTQHEPTCHLAQRAEMQCAMLLDPASVPAALVYRERPIERQISCTDFSVRGLRRRDAFWS